MMLPVQLLNSSVVGTRVQDSFHQTYKCSSRQYENECLPSATHVFQICMWQCPLKPLHQTILLCQTLNLSTLQTRAKPQNYLDQCFVACLGMRAPRQLSGQTASQFSKSSELSKVRLSKHEVFVCLAFGSDAPKVHSFPQTSLTFCFSFVELN